jgi:hypothetical protein
VDNVVKGFLIKKKGGSYDVLEPCDGSGEGISDKLSLIR